jgi:signal transduction histidine kinase
LCIAKAQSNGYIAAILASIFSLVLALLLARTLYLKRQQNRNKRFILQLLTHELRTPIASLGMTVDLFRQEFDSLNDNSQQAMWRLLEDYQRLAQLTEASKGYLSSKESYNIANQEAYLSEWLEHTCSGQGVEFYLDEDKQLTLPFYWLTICLNNLIMNAKQHGKAPIKIHVSVNEKLCITVTDTGQFPSYWNRIRMKQNTNQDSNMGIGLSLVRHLMSHLGGKVIINTNPTRITLELPL